MDRNFKVRVAVGVLLFAIAMISLYTFDGMPFKIFFSLFTLVAAVELFSFLKRKNSFKHLILLIIELGFLLYGALFVSQIDIFHFWYVIVGVPGYDIFAYLSGKMWGGKLSKSSRPFPKISKNKTWEGTIVGLLVSFVLTITLMLVWGSFSTDWFYLFCGPLALIGDLLESYIKRQFKVKDSNEIVIKNKFFAKLELLVGGSDGHGGYLDRLDSVAFAAAILLILTNLI